MANQNEREIASVKINGKVIDIIASRHAMKRMIERNVDKYITASAVLALGHERIAELQDNNDEAIVIDKANNMSVVLGFNKNVITIITVINRSNVFVKNNTEIHHI